MSSLHVSKEYGHAGYLLKVDVSLDCNSDVYLPFFWAGLAAVVVYPLGVPLLYIMLLTYNRHPGARL